jgi:hypothetical protein
MLITSAYVAELARLGIDWSRLRDDHVSGMSKYDIAQEAYLYLLENPEKSACYAIAAVIADARRRVALECEMPDCIEEGVYEEGSDGDGPPVPTPADIEPSAIEAAAEILRGGTSAAADVLRCSRRRVQQLLSTNPVALAARLAAAAQAAAQLDLFAAEV